MYIRKDIVLGIVLIMLFINFSGCTDSNQPQNVDYNSDNQNTIDTSHYDQSFINSVYRIRNEIVSSNNDIDYALQKVDMDPSPSYGIENRDLYLDISLLAQDHMGIVGNNQNGLIDEYKLSSNYKAIRDEFETYLNAEKNYCDYLSRWAIEISYHVGADKDAYLKIANQEKSKAEASWARCINLINNL